MIYKKSLIMAVCLTGSLFAAHPDAATVPTAVTIKIAKVPAPSLKDRVLKVGRSIAKKPATVELAVVGTGLGILVGRELANLKYQPIKSYKQLVASRLAKTCLIGAAGVRLLTPIWKEVAPVVLAAWRAR